MKNKTVLSYSGGLDSTVLLYKLIAEGDEVHCLNFHYGSKHNEVERRQAKKICALNSIPFIDVELPFIDKLFNSDLLKSGNDLPLGHYTEASMKQTVVPGRNTIMLSIAIGYAESIKAQRIAIANHADDHGTYPDTRPEWVASMSLVAYHGTFDHVKLYAPFTHLRKSEICSLGNELEVPFGETWTCYAGGEVHCGKCGACSGRKEAFAIAGIADPTTYLA